MPIWITWLIEGAGSLIRALFGSKEPTVADEATKAATASADLKQEQAAYDQSQKVASAATAADAVVVSELGNGDTVNADPAAPINQDPNLHLRP